MTSLSSARLLVGVLSKNFLRKQIVTHFNNRKAFFHSSRKLWDQIEIKMPSLSPTMTEGTIVKWLKKEGDPISPGDVLCEIQTDKAVVGLETEEEGVLAKILVPEDTQNVQLGEIIAIITGEGETVVLPTTKKVAAIPKPEPVKEIPKVKKSESSRLIGPSVKKLLEEYSIKLDDLSGTGPRQNLLKGDVLKYISSKNLKPAPKLVDKLMKVSIPKISRKGKFTDIPVTSSESENARLVLESKKNIPHGYMSADCKIDKVIDFKKKYIKDGVDVSVIDFVVRSVVIALKKVPKLKSIRQNGQLKLANSVNICVTDYNDGNSATVILNNAESLNIRSISDQIKASKSVNSNAKPLAGMFRISNLSMFGITEYIEVISPTDVATLTISGINYSFEDETPVRKLRASLSFDNYAIGELEAGEFLETFKKCIENPLNIISI